MPSKRDLFLIFLFSLAQANPVKQDKSKPLSFGPPATHSTFNTAPSNPRSRPFGSNLADQKSALAFAEWYIEQVLKYPKDALLMTEADVRQDASTGVWRVDVRQVAHNQTIEIVDGNLSLNIFHGEVISYGDSFYRGSAEDLTASPSDFDDFDLTPIPQYNLQTYCQTISQFVHHQWMRENPKWRDWFKRLSKTRKAPGELFELQRKCQQNIQRAFEKCIQESLAASAPTSWFQKASVWFQREVMHDYSNTAHVYRECGHLEMRDPLDLNTPSPFKVATTYDEDTCTWDFVTNFSTASAHLQSLHQFHCDARPRPNLLCGTPDSNYFLEDIDFYTGSELEQLVRGDKSELMKKEGIMDPAVAAVLLVVAFPHGENDAFWEVKRSPGVALRKIEGLRRPDSGRYVFELKNVPGANGSVNATLVYVQTPPRQPPGFFDFEEDEEESETGPNSSLTRAWKLSILFKNGRKFDGYVEAGFPGALIRLLDLSILPKQPQGLLSSPPPEVLKALSEGEERGESCFGWGESAAIREGVKQFVGGLGSDGGKNELVSKEGEMAKPSTYRSLNRPLYWGVERMGRVWTDILDSVNQTVSAHGNEGTSEYEVPADSNPSDSTPETQTASKDGILASLIPASFALLPCNPTFLMARDALIQADRIIFGGNHACHLWRGFAERGLGLSAQGAAEMTWTPWGGGKRKDGFDTPVECTSVGREGMKGDAMKNRRDEL